MDETKKHVWPLSSSVLLGYSLLRSNWRVVSPEGSNVAFVVHFTFGFCPITLYLNLNRGRRVQILKSWKCSPHFLHSVVFWFCQPVIFRRPHTPSFRLTSLRPSLKCVFKQYHAPKITAFHTTHTHRKKNIYDAPNTNTQFIVHTIKV